MLPESRFYRAVRQFAASSPTWDTTRILVETTPADRFDLTLVSQRVYGTRDEFLAVMAAAGLDRFDQELTERTLVLPNKQRLQMLKDAAGYFSAAPVSVR